MKINLSYILYLGILIQLFATQGIIMFNIFNSLGYWELKSFVHLFGLSLCLIYFFLVGLSKNSRIKFTTIEVLFFSYLLLSSISLLWNIDSILWNIDSIQSLFISFREVILVFLLILIYKHGKLSSKQWRNILKVVYILVIVNIIFILLTYLLGPEKYMKLVTGRYVWPIDYEYKFKISNFYLFWRSPALIGESAAVGFFGLLSYFIFIEDANYKNKRFLPLILTILSFTRSIYLILLVFLFIKFLVKKKNLRNMEFILPYLPLTLVLLAIPLYLYNLFSIKSIIMRINHWTDDINVKYNWLFGGAFGKVGGAARGEGFVSTLDSYWLLMLTSTGLIGIILSIIFIYQRTGNNQTKKIILISIFFGCLFITASQSIPFLVLLPIIFINKSFIDEKKISA